MCMLQCHSAGVPGGAVEELSGDAGADAGRERLSSDWIPAREGQLKAFTKKCLCYMFTFICCWVKRESYVDVHHDLH